MSNHTPGPWHACNGGNCTCKQVWSDNDYLCTVVAGNWGDGGIVYGNVPESVAVANARLIASAPEAFEVCRLLSLRKGDDPLIAKAKAVVVRIEGRRES